MRSSIVRVAVVLCSVLAVHVARAGDGSFHSCQITNGQVFSCDGAWYQGTTVVLHEGAYHNCQIVNGQVFSCDGAWYQGKATVRRR